METERYVVTLFGIDSNLYTDQYISFLWESCANEEFSNNDIYITALISNKTLVCGKIRGCQLGETAYVITTVRNPVDYVDEENFFASFRNVINRIREKLDYPCMTISIERVEYYYFLQPGS